MSELSSNPALDDGDAAAAAASEDNMFYVVSRRKLAILFIVTFGMYAVYWFYKNWSRYKHHASWTAEDRPRVWPVPRAIFVVFFIHSLFSKVKEYGREKPAVAAWDNNATATIMVLLYIAISILDRLAKRSIGLPYTDILSFVGMVPLLFTFLKAQAMINASCNDPEGKGNDKLTGANYVWIVIGGLLWVLAISKGFTSGVHDGFDGATSGSF
jgi:hypothetical protein